MRREQIVYKKDGSVDFEKSIENEINRLEARNKEDEEYQTMFDRLVKKAETIKNSVLPEITEEFADFLQTIVKSKCLSYKEKRNIRETLTGEETVVEYNHPSDVYMYPHYHADAALNGFPYQLIKDLFFRSDVTWCTSYISEISIGENIIYKNEMPFDVDYLQMADMIAKTYGKNAAEAYIKCAKEFLSIGRIIKGSTFDEKENILNNAKKQFDMASKYVYPQRVNDLAEYLLLNATELHIKYTQGSNEISTRSYDIVIEALKMINEDKKVSEIIEFVHSSYFQSISAFNRDEVYLLLLEYGKEKGVQIFEELFIKPSERQKTGDIVWCDGVEVFALEKYKELIKSIREENQKFEAENAFS